MSYLLHQLVDRAAASAPDREALCFEGDSLSYAEYAQRTDRCAAALHELGIRRGDRVGIFASKGIDAAVAQYGIWKAGAASVPFDPWLPPERLALMLRDCEIRVFFTDRSRLRRLQAAPLQGTGLEHLVGIEADDSLPVPALGWGEIERLPTRPPDICLTEQDLAYIFYTSGSTGEPKGMMHTHRSGLSFVDFTVEIFDLLPEDRFGNHAPLHFDLSIFDYVSAASVAATTVIVSEERQKLPASFSQLIEDDHITVLYSVPAAWTQMLARGALEARNFTSLRLVLYGGESLPTHQLRLAMEHAPEARFCQVYGVTETNVCTYFFVPRPAPAGDVPIPIGQICPNMEGVVLGDDDTPVGDGESGDLAIRGPGVMRGYWNRPDLNSEVFWRRTEQEDPFYRTGDLVRSDANGDFVFLGRKDRQIKSRGHRIELDEIQAALGADPLVAEAAVYAVPDGEGSLQLEAALALREGAQWDQAAVVRRLRERTAAYAVPAEIRVVARLPRTSAGKVDFRELKSSIACGSERPGAMG